MPGTRTLNSHDALMGDMARTLGADLDEAELRGDLPPEERADMLLSCTGCSNPCGCREWLGQHEQAAEAPGYCRNGDRLSELARQF